VGRVKDSTKGEKVAVVYDSIGRDTFLKSLDCLRPLRLMVCFGRVCGTDWSGRCQHIRAEGLALRRTPSLNTYAAKRDDLVATARDLFDVVRSRKVKIKINQTYLLKEAAEAHQDLDGRKTTGSTAFTI
jgi:NADPH:quinone reductase